MRCSTRLCPLCQSSVGKGERSRDQCSSKHDFTTNTFMKKMVYISGSKPINSIFVPGYFEAVVVVSDVGSCAGHCRHRERHMAARKPHMLIYWPHSNPPRVLFMPRSILDLSLEDVFLHLNPSFFLILPRSPVGIMWSLSEETLTPFQLTLERGSTGAELCSMAQNRLVPTYHCCLSARPAVDIVLTRLQSKHSFTVHMS